MIKDILEKMLKKERSIFGNQQKVAVRGLMLTATGLVRIVTLFVRIGMMSSG